MRIEWKQAALADMAEIRDWIAADNRDAALRVIRHIRSEVELLRHNPHLGRAGQVSGTRELVVSRYPYIVIYQIEPEAVALLAIFHTSRLWWEGLDRA